MALPIWGARRLRGRVLLSLHRCCAVEPLAHGLGGDKSGLAVHHAAPRHHNKMGDSANLKARGKLWVLVSVDLEDERAAFVLFCDLFKMRRSHAA